MKTITFLRHSKLEPPYDNYNLLDYQLLCGLADKSIDPQINFEFAKEKLHNSYTNLKPEIILHSPAKRTIQTANVFKNYFDTRTKQIEDLKEIPFKLTNLISESEFKKNGMSKIRTSFWQKVLIDELEESLESIHKRIKSIDNQLSNRHESKILCITHGFFMRFLRIYFLDKNLEFNGLTVQSLAEVINDDYLNGFTVEI